MLSHNHKPCVIDADGLNILSGFSAQEEDGWVRRPGQYVLTPHMKEMSRLTGYTVEELKQNRMPAKEYADQKQVVCVMKDSRTAAAGPGSAFYLNTSGNSALAKGGSGDVLAGLTAGLMAQKMDSYEASVLAVYLHGLAGDAAKDACGAHSVLAEDILTGIRKTIQTLEEKRE